jgi:hypothetical protein
MGLRHVDFTFLYPVRDRLTEAAKETVVFIRPFMSSLHRVYSTPEKRRTEIVEVLNQTCAICYKGVWYFKITDEITRAVVADPLTDLDIEPVFAEPDTEGIN